MRKLVVSTFMSLDGVMQGPGGPEEDRSGAFEHGGWSVNYWDEVMGQTMGESFSQPFDLLLGRKTYEIFAAHWPYITDDPTADTLNNAVKHVASTTLDTVDWNNSTLLEGDVPAAVAALKAQDGPELSVQGSGDLIQTLLRHDLVDEFRVWTFPMVIGSGKRLFGVGAIPAAFRVVESKTSTTGVLMTTYERAGGIDYGSFALEQPTEAEAARREQAAGG